MKIVETNSFISKMKASEKPKIEFHIDSVKGKPIKEPEDHAAKDKSNDQGEDLFDNFDDLRLK